MKPRKIIQVFRTTSACASSCDTTLLVAFWECLKFDKIKYMKRNRTKLDFVIFFSSYFLMSNWISNKYLAKFLLFFVLTVEITSGFCFGVLFSVDCHICNWEFLKYFRCRDWVLWHFCVWSGFIDWKIPSRWWFCGWNGVFSLKSVCHVLPHPQKLFNFKFPQKNSLKGNWICN